MREHQDKPAEQWLLDWAVKGEAGKTYKLKVASGFIREYLCGSVVLDLGFKGHVDGSVPITPNAIGIDIDFPGYDGIKLPFADESSGIKAIGTVQRYRSGYRPPKILCACGP